MIVFGRAIYNISHTNGTSDEVDTYIGTTATDCRGSYGEDAGNVLPAGLPTVSGWFITNTASRPFTVTAGTNTFFLNTIQFGGATTNAFYYGYIQAIFYPN